MYYFKVKKIGEVTKAKNINADSPKILKPTDFSCTKDFKGDSFSALTNINTNMKKSNNKAKNTTDIKAELKFSGY